MNCKHCGKEIVYGRTRSSLTAWHHRDAWDTACLLYAEPEDTTFPIPEEKRPSGPTIQVSEEVIEELRKKVDKVEETVKMRYDATMVLKTAYDQIAERVSTLAENLKWAERAVEDNKESLRAFLDSAPEDITCPIPETDPVQQAMNATREAMLNSLPHQQSAPLSARIDALAERVEKLEKRIDTCVISALTNETRDERIAALNARIENVEGATLIYGTDRRITALEKRFVKHRHYLCTAEDVIERGYPASPKTGGVVEEET